MFFALLRQPCQNTTAFYMCQHLFLKIFIFFKQLAQFIFSPIICMCIQKVLFMKCTCFSSSVSQCLYICLKRNLMHNCVSFCLYTQFHIFFFVLLYVFLPYTHIVHIACVWNSVFSTHTHSTTTPAQKTGPTFGRPCFYKYLKFDNHI